MVPPISGFNALFGLQQQQQQAGGILQGGGPLPSASPGNALLSLLHGNTRSSPQLAQVCIPRCF
jgi:hypothetical protein